MRAEQVNAVTEQLSAMQRAFRSGGSDMVHHVIRRNLTPESKGTLSQAMRAQRAKVRVELKAFGDALRKAVKSNSPEALIGVRFPKQDLFQLNTILANCGKGGWARILTPCAHCHNIAALNLANSVHSTGVRCFVGACCISNYVFSSIEGMLIPIAQAVRVYNAPGLFNMCSQRHAARNFRMMENGQYLSGDYAGVIAFNLGRAARDQWKVFNDPATNPFRPDYGQPILDYHHSKAFLHRMPSPMFDKRAIPLCIGFELEMEADITRASQDVQGSGSAYQRWLGTCTTKLKKLFNGDDGTKQYCLFERDGSVARGFEMVTNWTGLDTHEKFVELFASKQFKKIKDKYGLRSHDAGTCGLHVTVDRHQMSTLHAGKFAEFVNAPQNKPALEAFCRRDLNRYANANADKYGHGLVNAAKSVFNANTGGSNGRDRYELANFTNQYGVEFRLPRGTLRYESIMATLEMVRMLWFFTQTASNGNLTWPQFTDFVWKPENTGETRYMREYMLVKKLTQPYFTPRELVVINTKRRFNIQESLADALAMGFIAAKET
jgi:hypothetical protein